MKNSKTKISIITVVRNGRNTIEKTMLSILNQTYPNIEYIVIDGASKDGSLDIIKEYEKKLFNCEFKNVSFKFISEEDMGVYDGMNKGIKLANGEWINFMNAGDYFESEKVIENIYSDDKIQDKNVSVIYGDTIYINYDKNTIKSKKIELDNFWKGPCFAHQSCFVKTNLMKKYCFDITLKIASDYKFLFSLYNKGFIFLYLPISIAVFSVGGLSYNNYKSIIERYKVVSRTHYRIIHKVYYIYLIYITIIQDLFIKIIGKSNYALLRSLKWNINRLLVEHIR